MCAPEGCSAQHHASSSSRGRITHHKPRQQLCVLPWCLHLATETFFKAFGARGGAGLCLLTSVMGYKDKLLPGRSYSTKVNKGPKKQQMLQKSSLCDLRKLSQKVLKDEKLVMLAAMLKMETAL